MPVVPSIPARDAARHPPLTFEASLDYEDRLAANLHVQWPRLRRQRRRILTVALPIMLFVACLGTVSAWATADGRRDFGALLRDLPRFDPLPLVICLAGIALALVVTWAVFPARMRRQMRTMMGPRGRDGPQSVRFRLDADGIAQTLPGLVSFVPWHLIRGLDEDRRHLFINTAIGEEPIALRKADLSPDTAEGVRLRVRDWAGRGDTPSVPPPDPAEGAGGLRVTVDLTAADRAALIERALTAPAARRARLLGAAGWIIGLSLLYPVLVATLWCIDPYRVPFSAAFPIFVEMIGTDFWQPAVGTVVLVALGLAVNRVMRRHAILSLAQEITAEAPPGKAEALIGEDGIVTLQDGAHARMAWSLFGTQERAGDLLILPMRWGSVLPLPSRAFDPDGLARFEALAARHLPERETPA